MDKTTDKNILLGIVYAVIAFLIWGLAPIYWKQVSFISPQELLGHRIVWGFLTLGLFLFYKRGKKIFEEIRMKGDKLLIASSILIFSNWFVFVWAINNNHILDASLGYYLNPLINILIGYLFFNEAMRPIKIQAIILAFVGVTLLFMSKSGSPSISLFLAVTFSLYGYLKKKSSLSSESALLFEMMMWVIPIILFFLYLIKKEQFHFIQVETWVSFYLVLAGIITITPLWLFNSSLKHLDLGTIGFLQYLAPSLQLIVGVLLYKEIFSDERFISFGFIWTGILFYLIDSFRNKRKNEK